MIERILWFCFLQFLCVVAPKVPLVGKRTGSAAHPIKVPLQNHHNVQYFGNITLGSPPQLFSMLFDSGSTDIIVLGHKYQRICNLPHIKKKCDTMQYREYDPAASDTFQAQKGTFSARFVDQSERSGYLAIDVLGIGSGDSRIEVKVPIGVSTIMKDDAQEADGIMGLAFNMGSSFKPTIMTPFECLISQADIPPKFGFYCKREPKGDIDSSAGLGGELYFGGYNPELVTSNVLTTVKVNKLTHLYYGWKFSLNGVKIGNKEVNFDGQDIDGDGVAGTTALPDTGSSSIGAPQGVVDLINYHIFNGRIPQDVHEQDMFLCASLPDNLPKIAFIINGKPLELGPEDYITSQMDGLLCTSRIHALGNAHEVILGYPFLQRYYTVFDYEKREMSFLRAKQPETDSGDLQPGYTGKIKLRENVPADYVDTLRRQLAQGGSISIPRTVMVPASQADVMDNFQAAMAGMGGNFQNMGLGGGFQPQRQQQSRGRSPLSMF